VITSSSSTELKRYGLRLIRSSREGGLLSNKPFPYDQSTLEKFSHARNWKSYWVSALHSYIAGDVLEVGAGLGTNTALISNPRVRSIRCIEPDEALAARMHEAVRAIGVTISVGTICSVSGRLFDSILYIDVLEHIEDDKSELAQAFRLLQPGGHLIVVAPAHQALYSPFDKALGHYRRYDRESLQSCSPPSSRLEKMEYLDCVGLLASGANKLALKQSAPSLRQILFWDRCMIPASKLLDPLFGYCLGKSIAAVWMRSR
jgi:ubiquinone/menaquinone biosynthesis C-methylase UbiE